MPSIATKQAITSHLISLNIEKTTTYDAGNPGHCLRQAQNCGRVKLVNGILFTCIYVHFNHKRYCSMIYKYWYTFQY